MSLYISRTPFRISFFGGGTDYPDWYRAEGGAVLSTTIDKYCYITCRYLPPFFPVTHRVVWSHIERVSTISEILHPAVREGLKMLGFSDRKGVEIHHQGDLPARAGMGSGSSFAAGLILALTHLKGESIDAETLYLKAIELEQTRLNDNVGSQDQVAVVCGGLNVIRFHPDGGIGVEPLDIPEQRRSDLEARLMLFFTGTSRLASDVAGRVIAELPNRADELRRMREMVDQAADILSGDGDLDEFGAMLHETWTLKRRLSSAISNPQIDEIYESARAHGAIGGKLLGAGTSGFMAFYVAPEHQPAVRETLSSLLQVPFEFENQGSVMINSGDGA